MAIDDATEHELAQIRATCGELGADEEMTELVLASHRHDRALLDVLLGEGGDLRNYVQHKLAIWEAIFHTHEEPSPAIGNGSFPENLVSDWSPHMSCWAQHTSTRIGRADQR